MIVTIDGPAGSGKSTVAAKLANKLGFLHLNSGALYRAIGLMSQSLGIPIEDDAALAKLAQRTKFEFVVRNTPPLNTLGGVAKVQVLVDGEDWAAKLFTAEAGKLASYVAVLPKLREVLTGVQQELSKTQSLVAEGRDAGSIVFPNAEAKFYLNASAEVRAKRRLRDLKLANEALTLSEVQKEMEARDGRDESREIAPQVAASDAIEVDTTDLSIEEVVNFLCEKIEERKTNKK